MCVTLRRRRKKAHQYFKLFIGRTPRDVTARRFPINILISVSFTDSTKKTAKKIRNKLRNKLICYFSDFFFFFLVIEYAATVLSRRLLLLLLPTQTAILFFQCQTNSRSYTQPITTLLTLRQSVSHIHTWATRKKETHDIEKFFFCFSLFLALNFPKIC